MNKKLNLTLILLSLLLISCEPLNNISESNIENKAPVDIKSNTDVNPKNNTNTDTNTNVNQKNNTESNADVNQTTTPRETFIIAGVGRNTIKDFCEFSLNNFIVSKRIEPEILTSSSSYYDVKNKDNIYIDIILNVTNLSNESKISEDLISARMKINNNEYQCFSLVESVDESNLEKSTSIKPQETRKIHYATEVPINDSIGELEVILTSNGTEYSNVFYPTQDSVKEITNLEKLTEEEYYLLIKEAKQNQQDYIDSIDDPKVKQSVQTPYSAAIAESTSLYIKYPTDIHTIDKALKRVLDGE